MEIVTEVIHWILTILAAVCYVVMLIFMVACLMAVSVPFTYRTTDEDRRKHLEQIGKSRRHS